MYTKGMYRQLQILKCPPNTNKTALKNWLFPNHVEIVKKIPGLKDYRVYVTHDESIFGPPSWDAFEEFHFENLETLTQAYESGAMRNQIEDIKKYGIDEPSLFQSVWAEEYIIAIPNGPKTIHTGKGKYCQMGTLKCPPGMSKNELKLWWLDEHAETGKFLEGLKWYTVSFPLENTPFETSPFDGYAAVWFDSIVELIKSSRSEIMKGQMDDVRNHNMDDPGLSKVVLADEFIITI
jgi:hypothetical protein